MKVLIATALVAIAIILWGGNVHNPWSSKDPRNPQGIQEYYFDIVDSDWTGISCREAGKKIVGAIRTEGIPWLVMYNKDPKRVYPMYPAGWTKKIWGTNSVDTDRLPADRADWCVMPGLGFHTAKFKASIEPNDIQ